MKPLLISSGEPAGIGPDLCIALAEYELPIVVLGDPNVLQARAKTLKKDIQLSAYSPHTSLNIRPNSLTYLPISCKAPVSPGKLNPQNAEYVLQLLNTGAQQCLQGDFAALVTAPVHKAVINEGGFPFTGHTEFFAEYFHAESVVMMLACKEMKVALVTTHLPLRHVPDAITKDLIKKILLQVHKSLKDEFGIAKPHIKVAGLNPHAGESGYLGLEEIEIIGPALDYLRAQGMNIEGPLPADTMFTKQHSCDVYVAMYHDQGLPVLKYTGFNRAVNITLGLPIIRTSVDHGTALDLAGTGLADCGSMLEAVHIAQEMAKNRIKA